jgi:hypothetical protein
MEDVRKWDFQGFLPLACDSNPPIFLLVLLS